MDESTSSLLSFIVSLIIIFVVFILVDIYDLSFREFDRSKNVSEIVTIEKYINNNLVCKHHID